jgi:hypothetical protein
MKENQIMKNCSTCARFDRNATASLGTGACLSATSPNSDRIMGAFGTCDSHEQSQPSDDAASIGEAA